MPRISGALDIVQVSDPTTPTTGRQFLYFKSDGLLYTKKPDGTVVQIVSPATTGRTVVSPALPYTAGYGETVFAATTGTVTVPTASSGAEVTVKNTGSGTVTVAASNPAAITDTFTRTSTTTPGSADTGQAWTVVRGTWGTNGSTAYSVTAVDDDLMAQNVGASDMTVSAKIGTLVANGYYGIAARCNLAGTSHYYAEVSPGGGMQVVRRVGSVYTTLGSAGTAVSGSVIQLTVSGTSITSKIDGAQTTNFTDGAITTGTYGAVRHGATATVSMSFDNFSAQSLASTNFIDGASTATLTTQYSAITVVSDGANWFII